MPIKRDLIYIISLLISLFTPACTPKPPTIPSTPRTFRTREAGDLRSLDPANGNDLVSQDILPQIYESLLEYDYSAPDYKLIPGLAEGMPVISADRKTWTLKIRHGVFFQDDPCFKNSQGKGRELTAQDFVYAFKRLALPSLHSEGWWILDHHFAGMNAFHERLSRVSASDNKNLLEVFAQEVVGVRAKNDHELEFRLIEPFPILKYALALPFTAPVPHEAVEAYGDADGNITRSPVGTGPFRLKSWESGFRVVLERNPAYYNPSLPGVDVATFDIIKQSQPALLGFMSGSLDELMLGGEGFSAALGPSGLSPELRQKGVTLSLAKPTQLTYLSFSMRDPLLGANKRLRQALSMMLDRDRWISLFLSGQGIKAVNAIPPGLVNRPKTSRIKYDYDLVRAKELLARAGYPNGRGLPALNIDMIGSDSESRQLGEWLAAQYAAAGVTLHVIYNTFPSYLQKVRRGQHQIALAGWTLDYPDPESIYQLLRAGTGEADTNLSGFNDPEMNRLYERLVSMEPGAERSLVAQKMDDILQEECPWALAYFRTPHLLIQKRLKNYNTNSLIPNRLKHYRVE